MIVWGQPTGTPLLTVGELHVWMADIDGLDPSTEYDSLLAPDERERAARFQFVEDRERYVRCRGVLRGLLARYQGLESARDVTLVYGPKGKPALVPSSVGSTTLHFSLSHADRLAVYAFTRSVEVGVDIERERAVPDLDDLIQVSFSAREQRAIAAVASSAERERAFFRCWTRKEAILKALGEGIGLRLESFAVSIAERGPIRVLEMDGDPTAADRWRLVPFSPGADFVGAVAYEGPRLAPKYYAYRNPTC